MLKALIVVTLLAVTGKLTMRRIKMCTSGGSMDLTMWMAFLVLVITTISALPNDLPGIPPQYVPYVKAILSGLVAFCIFLQRNAQQSGPNIPMFK